MCPLTASPPEVLSFDNSTIDNIFLTSYYKMTIKPDATYVVSRSGDKVDLSNGMSVTARVEYDQVTYFEYAMEALGVLFR